MTVKVFNFTSFAHELCDPVKNTRNVERTIEDFEYFNFKRETLVTLEKNVTNEIDTENKRPATNSPRKKSPDAKKQRTGAQSPKTSLFSLNFDSVANILGSGSADMKQILAADIQSQLDNEKMKDHNGPLLDVLRTVLEQVKCALTADAVGLSTAVSATTKVCFKWLKTAWLWFFATCMTSLISSLFWFPALDTDIRNEQTVVNQWGLF